MSYDAVLLVSFGGPEKPEDVLPFLENVTRGRRVPRERLLEVAEHYYHFGGRSPINDQNRALKAALEQELGRHGPALPVYWGNRNWHPLLADVVRQMKEDGIGRALAFVTSAFSSYSGCRQYQENIAEAREQVGDKAPQIDKIRVFYNHPGFLEAVVEQTRRALEQLPDAKRAEAVMVFTAHSLPLAMAAASPYVSQLEEASAYVAAALGWRNYRLAYQSRSGPPSQPWLEPDILQLIAELAQSGARQLVVVPIGFVSDHMEVLYDLDVEARQLCEQLGVTMIRAATVGTHPRFVQMIRELIVERMNGGGVIPGLCGPACCLPAGRSS